MVVAEIKQAKLNYFSIQDFVPLVMMNIGGNNTLKLREKIKTMARVDEVSPGCLVKIKFYPPGKRPGFWNSAGEMDHYMGMVSKVNEVYEKNCPPYVKLEIDSGRWSWRIEDVILIATITDPNHKFRIRKLKKVA